MNQQHYDVLIIGAGVSGIGMACHLKREAPQALAILERRQAMGGTWDLFHIRIRSILTCSPSAITSALDRRQVLADGASIKRYVAETAKETMSKSTSVQRGGKERRMVQRDKCWTVTAENEQTGDQKPTPLTSWWVVPVTTTMTRATNRFPRRERFQGPVVHPQHWPENLDYTGKKVVVIGSGATAITLVPTMAENAAHVTMLQRSPTYLMPLPSTDKITLAMKSTAGQTAYRLTRARNISISRFLFERSRKSPKAMRRLFLSIIKRQLNGKSDMRHFSQDYNPWDQRMCVVKDGDLFEDIKAGSASIKTDQIEGFNETGIRLKSGEELEADIIVPATGLDIQMLGGIKPRVDGQEVVLKDSGSTRT